MAVELRKLSQFEARGTRFGNVAEDRETRNLLHRPICAIDGEGNTTPDGLHHYNMLQAVWSGGRGKIDGFSLSTVECLRFLLSLPDKHVYVIYGGSYDFNMILRDLSRDAKAKLLKDNYVRYKGFSIFWLEHKYLSIKRGKRSVRVYDVIAWWQCSFVKACRAWSVGTVEQLELVERMKGQRGAFADVDTKLIEDYCWLECELLIELVAKLREAILETPYRPKALYGPGALAAAILERENVKNYYGDFPDDVCNRAYFGGRFDQSMLGWFTDVWQYDIRSAYPDQIRNLPCLSHATWELSNNPAIYRYGVFHVRWNVKEDTPWPPFPWREHDGTVWYPIEGEGWYHAGEVNAAIELFGSQIEVIEGYGLKQECDDKPFEFVERLYQWRLQLAKTNPERGVIVKLGLNSLYGKLAQTIGFHDQKPPFQNFFYAGAITSGTRAKILRALAQAPNDVIGIATDGIFSLRRLDLPISKELGDWELTQLLTHAQVSNGVYHSVKVENDGKRKDIEKARGIGIRELDWARLEQDFRRYGAYGDHWYIRRARFIGIREAFSYNQPDIECSWRTEERVLRFFPARRWVVDDRPYREPPYYSPDEPIQFRLEGLRKLGLSYPFRKKTTWAEVWSERRKHQRDNDYLDTVT